MVVSCCNHVSHVRSSASPSLTLSRVPLFWWVLVPHTVTPFLLYHATPFSLHKFPKHLFPLLGLLWLWVWCFLCTPAKTHSTTLSTITLYTAQSTAALSSTNLSYLSLSNGFVEKTLVLLMAELPDGRFDGVFRLDWTTSGDTVNGRLRTVLAV